MTDREKVFLILGYAQGNIEIIVTLASIAGIPLSLFDECAELANQFKDEFKTKSKLQC